MMPENFYAFPVVEEVGDVVKEMRATSIRP